MGLRGIELGRAGLSSRIPPRRLVAARLVDFWGGKQSKTGIETVSHASLANAYPPGLDNPQALLW